MKKTNVQVNCKACGEPMNVDELLVSQFEKSIRTELKSELTRRESELSKQKQEFKILSSQLNQEKEEIETLVNSKVKSLLVSKEESLKESIRKEVNDEKILQLASLEKELAHKSIQLRDLNRTKADLERLRRDYEEAETVIILRKEKELTERLEQARSDIKEQAHQESFLKIAAKQKIIDDLKQKLELASLRAESGSQELKGESQELALEKILKNNFEADKITDVKRGQMGHDCTLEIMVNEKSISKVIFESKNVQNFSEGWITKLKSDLLAANGDIAILVVSNMPKGVTSNFITKSGIWICKFHEDSIVQLVTILRFALLKIHSVKISNQFKENKIEHLYDYICSDEFRNISEAALDSLNQIEKLHAEERMKMQKLWAQKEQLLKCAIGHTVSLFGNLNGIHSIPTFNILELPKAV